MFSPLSGCTNSVQMPAPKGKEIKLTSSELEERYKLLSFETQNDKIIQTNSFVRTKTVNNERKSLNSQTTKATRDLRTGEFWSDSSRELDVNNQNVKIAIQGYENNQSTYFSLNRKEPKKTNSASSTLENGKYMIEKSGFAFETLIDVSLYFNAPIQNPSFKTILLDFQIGFLLQLNYLRYNKIKFYEDDNYFTISLKSDVKNTAKQSKEIQGAFNQYFGIDYAKHKTFNYDLLLIFKDRQIVSTGIQMKTEVEQKSQNQDAYQLSERNMVTSCIDKTPKAVNPSQYQLIEPLG